MQGGKSEFGEEAVEYHSKDFDWEELKRIVESNSCLSYHFFPFKSSPSSACVDSTAWSNFHNSTGKFFKERRYLLKEFPELVTCSVCCKVLEVGCGKAIKKYWFCTMLLWKTLLYQRKLQKGKL